MATPFPSDETERDRMFADVYAELRRSARRLLQREAPYLTMEATDLVNEAALRILKMDRMTWNDRQHFFATGARILRQAMLDTIRNRKAAKRQAPTLAYDGGDFQDELDVEALDAALVRLDAASPDLARIVELRFYVGLSLEEIAAVADLSESTVKRRWKTARLWLASELTQS